MIPESITFQASSGLRQTDTDSLPACASLGLKHFTIGLGKYASCLLFVIVTLLSSCGGKSAEEIENELSSGVVLIQNKSFYEARLPNGESLYFTSFDDEDGIVGLKTDIDSVEMAVSYGTGFFISSDGKIATNHHVVSNMTEDKDIKNSFSSLIDALKSALSDEYDELNEKYEQASSLAAIALFDPDYTVEEYYACSEVRDNLAKEMQACQEIYSELSNLKVENSDIIYHSELAIGYNDSYVTKDSDLFSCVLRTTDKDNDLAIIQLKDKKTPESKHVFTISEKDPLEEYTLMETIGKTFNNDKNAQVYMPAFNLGPALAITEDGLRLQFSSGEISRKTSDEVMYTIPSLHGSSGSPIVNKNGEVVAINKSGVRGSDNFNNGTRVKHLHKLAGEL